MVVCVRRGWAAKHGSADEEEELGQGSQSGTNYPIRKTPNHPCQIQKSDRGGGGCIPQGFKFEIAMCKWGDACETVQEAGVRVCLMKSCARACERCACMRARSVRACDKHAYVYELCVCDEVCVAVTGMSDCER